MFLLRDVEFMDVCIHVGGLAPEHDTTLQGDLDVTACPFYNAMGM